MRKKSRYFLVTILLVLTGCAAPNEGGERTDPAIEESSFKWNREVVFNQSLEISKLKEWEYYGIGNEEIKIEDFTDPNRSQIKDLIGVKPVECLPLAVLIENSPESKAQFSLKQSHQDSSFPDKAMTYQLFVYESSSKAREMFDSVKSVANDCGIYTANYITDSYSQDLWKSAEMRDANLLLAYNTEYDEANAIGLIGSAIYTLYFLDFENLSDAKITLNEAIEVVSSTLKTAQGL